MYSFSRNDVIAYLESISMYLSVTLLSVVCMDMSVFITLWQLFHVSTCSSVRINNYTIYVLLRVDCWLNLNNVRQDELFLSPFRIRIILNSLRLKGICVSRNFLVLAFESVRTFRPTDSSPHVRFARFAYRRFAPGTWGETSIHRRPWGRMSSVGRNVMGRIAHGS